MPQGPLFTEDFLNEGIRGTEAWRALPAEVDAFRRQLQATFPIVERKDREAFDGIYVTRELIVWYKRALDAGDSDAFAPEAEVIRLAQSRGD